MAAPQILATGLTVAANVARLRRHKGLSLSTLSGLLAELTEQRRYPTSTLSEIEHGRRRVDVDDLLMLSAALDVSPATLLMPNNVEPDELVQTSGQRFSMPAGLLWDWLVAEKNKSNLKPLSWLANAIPPWGQKERLRQADVFEDILRRLSAHQSLSAAEPDSGPLAGSETETE